MTPRINNATLSGMLCDDRFSPGNRIVLNFSVLFVLTMIMIVVSYNHLHAIDQGALSLERDSVPGLYLSALLRAAMRNSHATLEYALFMDVNPKLTNQDLKHAVQFVRDLDKHSVDYESAIYRDDDRQRFHVYRAVVDKYLLMFSETVRLARASEPAVQAIARRAAPVWKETTTLADRLVVNSRAVTDELTCQTRASVQSIEIILAMALGVALFTALVLDYALFKTVTVPMTWVVDAHGDIRTSNLVGRLNLRRNDEFDTLGKGLNHMAEELASLTSQVQKLSLQVTMSVVEIAATSKERQATVAETIATATEIGVTSRETFATPHNLLRTVNEVSSVTEQSATLAGTSQNGLNRMKDTIRGVTETAGSVSAKLVILNGKATNINQVVSTITKMTDQTNLLSLNIAVRTEKADEYGRGFVVVATEIHRLADQTAVATCDIKQIIKEIQSAVSTDVTGVDKLSEEIQHDMHDAQQVGTQLPQIITEVQTLAPRFQMMSGGMQTQATGAEQITQALSQLPEATQQTVELLRQSSQAIDDLTLMANQLHTGVSRFKIEV